MSHSMVCVSTSKNSYSYFLNFDHKKVFDKFSYYGRLKLPNYIDQLANFRERETESKRDEGTYLVY